MATLAELVIKLSADSASLRQDFYKVGKMAEDLKAKISSALGALGVTLTIAGIGAAIKSAADFGESMHLAAQKTGMAIEEISALSFAGKAAGVDFEQLQKGLAIFDKNVVGMGLGSNAAQKALAALGISARDSHGQILPVHELLLKIAERFSTSANSAEKTAVAMALFGRSGAAMIPLLNEGSDGIQKLEARAAQLGIVLDEQSASGAKTFHDELEALDAALLGLKFSLAKHAFPGLTLLAELFLRNKYAITVFKAEMAILGLELAKLGSYITDPFGLGKLRPQIKAQMDAAYDDMGESYQKLQKELGDLAGFGRGGGKALSVPGKTEKDKKGPKDTFEFEKKALQDYGKLCDELRPKLAPTRAAIQEYFTTLHQVWAIESAGFNVEGMALRNQIRFNEQYAKALEEETNQLDAIIRKQGIPNAVPFQWGDKALGGVDILDKHKADLDILSAKARQLGGEMSNAFTQMIIFGRGFGDSLKSLVQLFAEFILKTVVFKSIAQSLGHGSGIGGLIGSFFGGLAGMKADGGPVMAGQSYLVGERGPEIFSPGVSGSIIPRGAGGGNTYVDARGADASVEYRVMRAMQAMYANASLNGYRLTQEMGRRS